ncbi:hypothetical protein HanXRQr2_Chr06g0268311 [Helianthus annuus]|uniref:Uncharacterized protein n=1 Tax=Helianthus annuus TaxID=4232 RepID=A0A9K3NK37_HELAN|nr:hypothetical protein HanXRQr2_Chr06g0268311 [Helianthus annuus]KAJ0916201.1 hypothetical protein HanPSC8_Chr06g0258951 [Helianthus annuus]
MNLDYEPNIIQPSLFRKLQSLQSRVRKRVYINDMLFGPRLHHHLSHTYPSYPSVSIR